MNYYPFHLGDYASHTAHLDPLEDIAYRRMLDLYYRTEQPLPDDVQDIARLIRMKDHVELVDGVLTEFFALTDDGWSHARCDAEIAKMQDKQTKAKASAQASVNARIAKQTSERSTNAQRTLNERSTDVELPTPTPTPIPTTPSGVVARKRATRKAPAEFSVDESMCQWLADSGITADAEAETAKFRDYTFKNPITDWVGAWRNWMRGANTFVKARASPTETPYARSMREKYEAVAPGIAARAPGQTKQIFDCEVIDAAPKLLG